MMPRETPSFVPQLHTGHIMRGIASVDDAVDVCYTYLKIRKVKMVSTKLVLDRARPVIVMMLSAFSCHSFVWPYKEY